jgi:hypothetical protein
MKKLIITVLIIFALIVENSFGQYKLKKYVFGSSATTTSSANYKVYNTVGQSVIGKSVNTDNILYAGFWNNINVPNQNIELTSGWNMISTYLNPSQPAMEDIWANISENVLIVKDNNGNVFIPMFEINTIGNWDPIQAYQVFMKSDAILKIEGNIINYLATPLNLMLGWNLAAYIKNSPLKVETALASITDDNSLVIVKNNDGNVYIPEFDINSIGNMIPGQGYQMYLNNNTDLLYPDDGFGRSASISLFPSPKTLKPEFTKTGNNQQILVKIPGINSNYEVGIYNRNNILIGSGTFRNGFSIVTIWGDNEKTDFVDGAVIKELLKLKLYDTHTGIYTELYDLNINNLLNNSIEKELLYRQDKLLYIESAGDFNVFADKININPNPIKNHGLINLFLKFSSDIEMNLFTVEGKLVRKIVSGSYTKGEYNFELFRDNLASGEYNIIYKSAGKILTKKLIISD